MFTSVPGQSKIKCNTEVCSWTKTLIVTGITGYCTTILGARVFCDRLHRNQSPWWCQKHRQGQETSSYLPKLNTFRFMSQRRNPLVLVRPIKLQIIACHEGKEEKCLCISSLLHSPWRLVARYVPACLTDHCNGDPLGLRCFIFILMKDNSILSR